MYKELRKLSNQEKKFVEELLFFSTGNNLEKFQMGSIISDKVNFHGISSIMGSFYDCKVTK